MTAKPDLRAHTSFMPREHDERFQSRALAEQSRQIRFANAEFSLVSSQIEDYEIEQGLQASFAQLLVAVDDQTKRFSKVVSENAFAAGIKLGRSCPRAGGFVRDYRG